MDSVHANFGTFTIWFLWVTRAFIILAVEEIAASSSRILWMKFQNLQHSLRNTTLSEMSERSGNDRHHCVKLKFPSSEEDYVVILVSAASAFLGKMR